jgi:hypothetical protein
MPSVSKRAASSEADPLALHAKEAPTDFENEVVSSVLGKGIRTGMSSCAAALAMANSAIAPFWLFVRADAGSDVLRCTTFSDMTRTLVRPSDGSGAPPPQR